MEAAKLHVVVDAQICAASGILTNATGNGRCGLTVGAGESLSYDTHAPKNRNAAVISSAHHTSVAK